MDRLIPQYLDPKNYIVHDLTTWGSKGSIDPHFDIIFPFDNEDEAKHFLSEILKRYNNYVKLIDRIEELEMDKARLVKEYNQITQTTKGED